MTRKDWENFAILLLLLLFFVKEICVANVSDPWLSVRFPNYCLQFIRSGQETASVSGSC